MTWKRACAVLNSPGRSLAPSTARVHLLVGFLVCGHPGCGTRLVSVCSNHQPGYACRKIEGRSGCGKLTITAAILDEYVKEWVLREATMPGFRDLYVPVNPQKYADASAELGRLQAQRAELEDARFVDGTVSHAAFTKLAAKLDAKIAAADHNAEDALGATMLAGVATTRPALERQWADADLDWRRALIARHVERVVVLPAGRGARFTPDRVQIDPRGASDDG